MIQITITIPQGVTIPSLNIHSLVFPIVIKDDIMLISQGLDLFTRSAKIENLSRQLYALNHVALGTETGLIKGYFRNLILIAGTFPWETR
jgi:hypothetical protein